MAHHGSAADARLAVPAIISVLGDASLSALPLLQNARPSDAGLVRDRRHGRERIWELQTARLEVAHRCLDRISTQWDIAIGRLKTFVEGDN
jgi:hypothetical protein